MNPGETRPVPAPAPMPVDTEKWRATVDLSAFVNAYYQYSDLQALGNCRSVLIIGPGQGLSTEVLRWRGYEVTTFDIDSAFEPDFLGSVHDLGVFSERRFDAVIASHVLEHLPVPYLDRSLDEIARVGRHAIIYLPVHGRHAQARLIAGIRGLDLSLIVDLFNYLEKPSGVEAKYMSGQHYWELGMRGFRVRDLKRRFSKRFDVMQAYRNRDWLPSYNFVLRSKRFA